MIIENNQKHMFQFVFEWYTTIKILSFQIVTIKFQILCTKFVRSTVTYHNL